MTLRENIERLVEKTLLEVETELTLAENKLNNVKSEQGRVLNEVVALEKQASLVKDWISTETTEINNCTAGLKQRISDHESEKSVFLNNLSSLQGDIEVKKKEIEHLDRLIVTKRRESDAAVQLESVRVQLVAELANLNDSITLKRDEVKSLQKDILQLNDTASLNKETFLKENKEAIDSLQKRQADVIARESSLATKAKELDNKEADLKTVELRWKKIYESKGAGFKI